MITFDIDDIPPEDFLDRIRATIGVGRDYEQLGWKTCDDKKKVPYHRLQDANDVKQAFATHAKMLENKLRRKPVFMEVANLVSIPVRMTSSINQFPG
jgi:hypothetical protein